MSKYTTEIRFICESAIPLDKQGDGSNVEDAIESGRSVLFNFDYVLFSDEYKSVIESKFIRHNYVREIGFETVGLFKLRLRDEWLMKLPYYNQLWSSALLKFDPFLDTDYQVQHTGSGNVKRNDTTNSTNSGIHAQNDTTSNTTTGNRNENTKQEVDANAIASETGTNSGSESATRKEDLLQKYSDTPQGALDGVIDTDWLTNATQNDNTINDNKNSKSVDNRNAVNKSNSVGSGSSNIVTLDNNYGKAVKDILTNNTGKIVVDGNTVNSDTYLRHVWGKYNSRSYSKALMEFRETFLNIDEMFINEFKKLFMLIY